MPVVTPSFDTELDRGEGPFRGYLASSRLKVRAGDAVSFHTHSAATTQMSRNEQGWDAHREQDLALALRRRSSCRPTRVEDSAHHGG